MAHTMTVLESFAILICKHDIHMLLGDDRDEECSCYNALMYLLDRPNTSYKGMVSVPRISSTQEADVCGSCYSYFGHTYSGRYRVGCHLCHDEERSRSRLITFARLTGLDIRQSETILSTVIYKYLIGEDVS